MPFHHVAVAVKNARRSHVFYSQAMGFKLVKVVKRLREGGGWSKHIFYDTGDGHLFAIWDLKGMEGKGLDDASWIGGMSTGANLPTWANHLAFDCKDLAGLEVAKQRWLDHGYHVSELVHDFIHSIYTMDPDGTLVEFTFKTRPLDQADFDEAQTLIDDDTPATETEGEGSVIKSPNYNARKNADAIYELPRDLP
jgi:catechol 2,3-dioxygenase-like lactoylglutathione lyase family enzyme